MYDVIIPARNEELTIGRIVNTFVHHPDIGSVIVAVDDDTRDDTASIAAHNLGIVLGGKRGKGQNIKVGLTYVTSKYTILCDGDLQNFESKHIDTLIQEPAGKKHIIGVPDVPNDDIVNSVVVQRNPWFLAKILQAFPWVSGERLVLTWVLRAIPLHGYLTEVQINKTCADAGMIPEFRRLNGLYTPFKLSPQRMEEMERDREWGEANGWLPKGKI